MKLVNDEIWLRCEVVFRRAGGSETLFYRVCEPEPIYSIDNAFCGAIAALKCEELSLMFEPTSRPELPRFVRQESSGVKWLMEQVLPKFKQVISQHDGAAHEVAIAFLDTIRQAAPPNDWSEDL